MTSPRPLRPVTPEYVDIPRMNWEDVVGQINDMWVFKDSPHMSIIGQTGSGKSYFTRHAILPLVAWDKVLIIDVKGDDPTLRGLGQPVKEVPNRLYLSSRKRRRKRTAGDLWFRLTVPQDFKAARESVKAALDRVRGEGQWVVVIDETRYLCNPRIPSLNLAPQVEHLWLFGRSRENSVIAMTQAPKWVPSSFYEQASFAWIGRLRDEEAQKRLREIGGLQRAHLPVIQGLRKREFLLCADGGDLLAITGAPNRAG